MNESHRIITPGQSGPSTAEHIAAIVAEMESERTNYNQRMDECSARLKTLAGITEPVDADILGSRISFYDNVSAAALKEGKILFTGPSSAGKSEYLYRLDVESESSVGGTAEAVNSFGIAMRRITIVRGFIKLVEKLMAADGAHPLELSAAVAFCDSVGKRQTLFDHRLEKGAEFRLVNAILKALEVNSNTSEDRDFIVEFVRTAAARFSEASVQKITTVLLTLPGSSLTPFIVGYEGKNAFAQAPSFPPIGSIESLGIDPIKSTQTSKGKYGKHQKRCAGTILSWTGSAVLGCTVFTGSSSAMTWALLCIALLVSVIAGAIYYRDLQESAQHRLAGVN